MALGFEDSRGQGVKREEFFYACHSNPYNSTPPVVQVHSGACLRGLVHPLLFHWTLLE
jgi:hypothetical protein